LHLHNRLEAPVGVTAERRVRTRFKTVTRVKDEAISSSTEPMGPHQVMCHPWNQIDAWEEGKAMTDITQTAIATLTALTADVLKATDRPALDRLHQLAEQCLELISEEMERRNPIRPNLNVAAYLERTQDFMTKHIAELVACEAQNREVKERHAALQKEQQAALQEAIRCCGNNPDLQARLKAMLERGILAAKAWQEGFFLAVKAWQEGFAGSRRGHTVSVNPYPPGTETALAWQSGMVERHTRPLRAED
jgi:hypothetical protein